MDFDGAFTSNNVDDIDGFEPVQQEQQGDVFEEHLPQQQQEAEEQQQQAQDDVFGLGGFDPVQPSPSASQRQQQQDSAFFSAPAASSGVSQAKRDWDEKKARQLAARKESQQKGLQQNIAQGKRELEDFQSKRTTHTNKLKATNRTEEKETRSELESTLQNGSEWEKVAKYCDLKPKHDPKIATLPNNTERMRTLLIDLKNDKTAK